MTLFNFKKVKKYIEKYIEKFVEEPKECVKQDLPRSIRKFDYNFFEVGQGRIEITVGRKVYKTPHAKGFMEAVSEQSYTHHLFRTQVLVGQKSQYAIIGKRITEILGKTLTNLTRLQGLIQLPGTDEFVHLSKVSKIIFKRRKLRVKVIVGYEDVAHPELNK